MLTGKGNPFWGGELGEKEIKEFLAGGIVLKGNYMQQCVSPVGKRKDRGLD